MLDTGIGGVALLLAHHADAFAAETAEAAEQRLVIGEFAIAGERREFGDQRVDEVGEVRPLRMARDQRLLPRRQIGVEIGQRLRRLLLDLADLLADIGAGRGERAQLVHLGIEFSDGLFEIEVGAHLVQHQANIGKNRRGGETVFGRAWESAPGQGFSPFPGRVDANGRKRRGSFAGVRAEVKAG